MILQQDHVALSAFLHLRDQLPAARRRVACHCGFPQQGGHLEQDILGQTEKIENIYGKVEDISTAKMYRTELVVEGTSIFRDKGQQSILRCKVLSWDKDITDTLPDSSFPGTASPAMRRWMLIGTGCMEE